MFCRSLYPATATMQWVTSTYTQFGPSVESVAVYVATLRVEDQGTRSHTVVTASGPVIASDLRGPDSVLWAMAVLITSTSPSSSQDPTTAATETSARNTGAATANMPQVPASFSTSPTATPTYTPTAGVQNNGLSTSGAVGLAVGVTTAVLLVILGGWLLYRRGVVRGQRASEERLKEEQDTSEQQTASNGDIAAGGEWSTQYHGYGYDHGVYRWPQELEPTPPRPRELEAIPPKPRELE